MNIAYKIITGKDVSKDELKYLLFLTLSEYQHHTSNETVGITDELECFNMDDLLDTLSWQLEGIERDRHTDDYKN
jgi:hypothetical protein